MHTTSIRIGILVSAIPFRNSTFQARRALTLDHLSKGRLELGLERRASGTLDQSYIAAGIGDWPLAECRAHLQEAVEIVDQLP